MGYAVISKWIGITMTLARLNVIPQAELEADQQWAEKATWYEATIRGNGYSFDIPYGMGVGNGDTMPTLDDIMDSLCSISRDAENALGFEDWAGDFGYDADSRKAEQVYLSHKYLANQLRSVCGGEAKYERLLSKQTTV